MSVEDQKWPTLGRLALELGLKEIASYGEMEFLGYSQASELLGVSIDQIQEMLDENTLVGLPAGEMVVIPSWQFQIDKPEVVEEIASIMSLHPNDSWGVADLLTSKQPGLEGSVPVDELRSGDPERVNKALRFGIDLIQNEYGQA